MKNSPLILAVIVSALSQNVFSNEATTSAYFAKTLQEKNYAELTQFLNLMPKGGDLHHHFSGSLYVEDYFNFLISKNKLNSDIYCVLTKETKEIDQKNGKSKVLPIFSVQKISQKFNENNNCIGLTDAKKDQTIYTNVLKNWSQLNYFNHIHIQDTPYNHFFNAFPYFSDFAKENTLDGLIKIGNRAQSENVLYIETMLKSAPILDITTDPAFMTHLKNAEKNKNPKNLIDYILSSKKLIIESTTNKEIENINNLVSAYQDKMKDENKYVKIKFQLYATRNEPLDITVTRLITAYEIYLKSLKSSNNIIGINFVSAEHSPFSMENYEFHMELFKYLNKVYEDRIKKELNNRPNQKINLALHAGELALGLVEPEKLTSNIHSAIEAGAKRIGHGVSISYEDPIVLQNLKNKNIAVEINLTSNEVILGVKDEYHPVKLYQKLGVPFVISTDDSGVSRNNLTNEYFKFSTRYNPTYSQLKTVVKNSITYSFLSEKEKNELLNNLNTKFKNFEERF